MTATNNKRDDFEKIISMSSTHKDEQIARLEDELQEEKDARKEERFIWIFVSIILFDAVIFLSNTKPVATKKEKKD